MKFLKLKLLSSYFKEHNFEVLEVIVLKETIALKFHKSKDFAKAEKETLASIEKTSNSEAKYLLHEYLGKLYHDNSKTEKSITWLTKALNFNGTNQTNYIDTLLYAASAFSTTDILKLAELWSFVYRKSNKC